MKYSYLTAPLFKGVINNPEPEALLIANGGRDEKTDMELSREEYVQLLFKRRDRYPLLIQNVARAAAAAVLAHDVQHEGESRLVAVEGCEHVVGDRRFSGGALMKHLWENVVPREVMDELPPPEIRSVSRCTIEEIREVLSMRKHLPGQTTFITHDYHVDRTKSILKEERESAEVMEPLSVQESLSMHKSHAYFLKGVIRAAEPSSRIKNREQWMEKYVNGPLHTVSHVMEEATFGALNIEKTLAYILRKKPKLHSQNSV